MREKEQHRNHLPLFIDHGQVETLSLEQKNYHYQNTITSGQSKQTGDFFSFSGLEFWQKNKDPYSNDVIISRLIKILEDQNKVSFASANYSYFIDSEGNLKIITALETELQTVRITHVDDIIERNNILAKFIEKQKEKGNKGYSPSIIFPIININFNNSQVELLKEENSELEPVIGLYSYVACAMALLGYQDHNHGNLAIKNNQFFRLDFEQDMPDNQDFYTNNYIRKLLQDPDIETKQNDFLIAAFFGLFAHDSRECVYDFQVKYADESLRDTKIPMQYKLEIKKPLTIAPHKAEQFREFCNTYAYIISPEYQSLTAEFFAQLTEEIDSTNLEENAKAELRKKISEQMTILNAQLESSRYFYNEFLRDLHEINPTMSTAESWRSAVSSEPDLKMGKP